MLCKLSGVGMYLHWFCFWIACLLFRFRLVPRPAGWGVDLAVLVSIAVVMGLGRSTCVKLGCICCISY
jgi:hypothetical protein